MISTTATLEELIAISHRMGDGRMSASQRDERIREEFDNYIASAAVRGVSRSKLPPIPIITRVLHWKEKHAQSREYMFKKFRDNLDFCYLLGFYLGRDSFERKEKLPVRSVKFIANNQEVAAKLEDVLHNLSVQHYSKPLGKSTNLRASGTDFFSYVVEVTEYGTAVPWEHLLSTEHYKSFLSGVLDAAAVQVKKKGRFYGLSITKTKCPALLRQLTVAFGLVGVYPSLIPSQTELYLRDPIDFWFLLDNKMVTSPKLKSLLQGSERSTMPYNRLFSAYHEARRLAKSDYNGRWEIARKYGMGRRIVYDWTHYGKVPYFIQRKDTFLKLLKEMPHPHNLPYFVEDIGLEPAMAKRLWAVYGDKDKFLALQASFPRLCASIDDKTIILSRDILPSFFRSYDAYLLHHNPPCDGFTLLQKTVGDIFKNLRYVSIDQTQGRGNIKIGNYALTINYSRKQCEIVDVSIVDTGSAYWERIAAGE